MKTVQLFKLSKTTQKYLKTMDKGYLTESEIIYLRKYLGQTGSCPENERRILLNKVANSNFPISPEQSTKGINWLTQFTFKKNGEPRQSKKVPFGKREQLVIKNFDSFTLVDFIDYRDLPDSRMTGYRQYLPIYRVHSKGGSHFDYVTNMGEITLVG